MTNIRYATHTFRDDVTLEESKCFSRAMQQYFFPLCFFTILFELVVLARKCRSFWDAWITSCFDSEVWSIVTVTTESTTFSLFFIEYKSKVEKNTATDMSEHRTLLTTSLHRARSSRKSQLLVNPCDVFYETWQSFLTSPARECVVVCD